MPSINVATLGAVALIRRAISSTPLRTYLSLHGDPNGNTEAQFLMIDEKPMSLPPISSVTIFASDCTDPSWLLVTSPVVAPLQLTSTKRVGAITGRRRCG